jgi:hypothetical protein
VTDFRANMPLPAAPMVDPQTGYPTTVWWRWMLTMFSRTGGGTGDSSAALAEFTANQARPGVAVTVGPSPFIYTAPSHGSILVGGNGVTRLEITANGATWFPTGSFYGAFPLAKSSQARISFVGSPSMVFIPG